MKNNININVIENDFVQSLLHDVTELVARTILHTFGPYGQNTLIQTASTIYSTKDGWTVAKTTKVTDLEGAYSVPANAIKKLILDVAQSVVVNAGDGTSTAIIAANIMNEKITKYAKSAGLGAKQIEELLEKCTAMVCDKLNEWAIPVNGNPDIIHKIASISTNGDLDLANIITDIYEKTNNPIIKVEESGNTKTYYDIIDGYDIVSRLELPNYCLTTDKGTFEADNPVILIFNSAVGRQHISTLVYISTQIDLTHRKLVVIAPTYDQDFINILANLNSEAAAKGEKPVNLVPIKYYAPSVIDKDCVADFVSLTGGVLMSNQYDKVHDIFTALNEKLHDSASKSRMTDIKKTNDELMKNVMLFAGTCEHIVATDKFVRIEGLTNANKEEFEGRKRELKAILDAKYKQYVSDAAISESIRQIRLRLGKMECKQGVIKVGGFGSAHIAARKDALDDAIRACEVAYNDGYVVDGGIAIAQAINSIICDEKQCDNKVNDILTLYMETFINVAALMYNNKFNDLEKSMLIATEYANKKGKCFDLITEQETTDLITPVDVLTEVIKGCMRLVLVNTTSNQFVFMNTDDIMKTIQSESIADDANRQTDD